MGKKILLADDSITIQKVIELTFSDEDFEVVTVGNGRLAMERIPDARPDLVLCDIIMPEKDGYEVCDFIKKTPSLAHIPVLLLTGAFEPFDQERAARVGCDGYLAKPFEPQTLITKVKDLLAKASKPAAAVAAAPSAPAPAFAVPAPAPSPVPAATTGFDAPRGTQPVAPWSAPAAVPAPVAMPAPPPPAPVPPPMDTATRAIPFPEPEPKRAEPMRAPEPPPPAVDDLEDDPYAGAQGIPDDEPALGTVKSPPYRGQEPDRFATKTPSSLEELYNDDSYGATDELMPLTDDESASVSGSAGEGAVDDEPAPWAQPTVEVPLEDRAQAGVESAQMAAESGFEEVFDAPPAAAAPAPEPPPPPAIVQGGFGFGREGAAATNPPVMPPASPSSTTEGSFRDLAETGDEPIAAKSVTGEVPVPVDMVEKIAQRVVAQISEKVIREIAWEVIPDLAEALIKREIERLKAELQNT